MFDIVFSPHNGFVAFGRWSGEVKVVATRDGRIVAELDGLGSRYPEKPLVFSPDDRYLGIFHENNAVSIVNTKTGQTEGRVRHDRHVTNHFFGPDSRLLLTVSFAGVARLISTKTGREVARYGPEEGIQDAEFTTNGKFVAFATKRGVQLFPSNPELLFKQLCEKAGANLSQGEWNDYIGESDPWHATCPNWRTPSDVGGTDRPP
jgi:WD40 repeat protein